jgi:hypothetical protein
VGELLNLLTAWWITSSTALHEPFAHVIRRGVGTEQEQGVGVGDLIQMLLMSNIYPFGSLDEFACVLRPEPTRLLHPRQVLAVRQSGE